MTGEFLSRGAGKVWTGKDGAEHRPEMVTLLVGDRTVRVEYPSAEDADFWTGGVGRGDVVTLPVFVQSPQGSAQVFFRGLRGQVA